MTVLAILWLVFAASMAGGAWLFVRLDRRLQRLKTLGLAPPSTPAMLGAEARLGSTMWLFSSAHAEIGDAVVNRLVLQIRWLTAAQSVGVLVWVTALMIVSG